MAVKLYAVAPGDESVGIRSAAWTVDDVELDDNEHREAVRGGFVAAFEALVGDHVVVTFSDEQREEEPAAHEEERPLALFSLRGDDDDAGSPPAGGGASP